MSGPDFQADVQETDIRPGTAQAKAARLTPPGGFSQFEVAFLLL
jgi:hypothetical protein